MATHRVKIADRSFSVIDTTNIGLNPTSWSGSVKGGFKKATVDVVAPEMVVGDLLKWLRYDVTIHGENGEKVWNGYVSEITIYFGNVSVGVSIDQLSNRVKVLYSYKNSFGKNFSERTAWLQDDLSVSTFGSKELITSKSNLTPSAATQYQQTKLNLTKNPVQSVEVSGGGRFGAQLVCKGWYNTLSWKYYRQQLGYEAYEGATGSQQPLGVGFTGNTIGFDAQAKRVHDLNGRFKFFEADWKFNIFNSTSNNTTFQVDNVEKDDPYTLSAGNIYYDPVDDIMLLSGSGMENFKADEMIKVTGSATVSNNRYYFVDTTSTNHLTVRPKSISSAPPASGTITKGNSVTTVETPVTEYPSANITVTVHGQKIAQHFSLGVTTGSWIASYCLLNVKKVGSPVDLINLQLCAVSGLNTYTVLDTATFDGSLLSDSEQWATFQFSSGNVTLSPGTTYALVLSRANSNDYQNYYVFGVDEEALYPRGSMYLFNGSVWVSRWINAQLPFKLYSKRATDLQITDLLQTSGQFFPTYEVTTPSNISTEQYMEKEDLSDKVLSTLLDIGTTNNKRYLSNVYASRHFRVYEEPTYDPNTVNWFLQQDGSIVDRGGKKIESGKLIFGEWVRISSIASLGDYFSQLSYFFVEESEYSSSSATLRLTPRSAKSYLDLQIIQDK